MFERYTEQARRTLSFARYEASHLGSVVINTEHLLLALIRDGGGLTGPILVRFGISREDIRRLNWKPSRLSARKLLRLSRFRSANPRSAFSSSRLRRRTGCFTTTSVPSICCWVFCATSGRSLQPFSSIRE
jgi:hypothetical protein